jgi:hypothetical protein
MDRLQTDFVDLTEDELARLEGALDGITVHGHRGFTC